MTVVVFSDSELSQRAADLREEDIEYRYEKGRGKGGQNVNKVANCVIARHKPTGLEFRVDGRNRQHNQKIALERLEKAFREQADAGLKADIDATRRERVGSGMRGDKIRTYRVQDGIVTDHRSNKKFSLANIMKGKHLAGI